MYNVICMCYERFRGSSHLPYLGFVNLDRRTPFFPYLLSTVFLGFFFLFLGMWLLLGAKFRQT